MNLHDDPLLLCISGEKCKLQVRIEGDISDGSSLILWNYKANLQLWIDKWDVRGLCSNCKDFTRGRNIVKKFS